MQIKNISLTNFRNFAKVDEIIFPDRALLVAAAPNATGKTNFLEALTVLLRARSFRAQLEDCIQWEASAFLIRGQVVTGQGESTLAVRYHRPTRKVRVEEDGLPASPVTFFARYPFILFLPEDTFMFNRGPAQRRTFLNHILVTSPLYLSALVQFHRVLKQRNAALKNATSFGEVAAWNELLVEHGRTIWNTREGLLQFIASHLSSMYERITGEKIIFAIRLATSVADKEKYLESLEATFKQDQRYGYTMHGPHRDDLELLAEEKPLALSFSRGQLRGAAVALKLVAHRYLAQTTHEEPLLLLDEVLSELDEARQQTLLENLPSSAQILLTTTSVPRILQHQPHVHLLDLRSITEAAMLPNPTLREKIPVVAVERVPTPQ